VSRKPGKAHTAIVPKPVLFEYLYHALALCLPCLKFGRCSDWFEVHEFLENERQDLQAVDVRIIASEL